MTAEEEYDSWVICPECLTSVIGNAGDRCFICNTVMKATPLYEVIAEEERHADKYTPEERAILDEFGL